MEYKFGIRRRGPALETELLQLWPGICHSCDVIFTKVKHVGCPRVEGEQLPTKGGLEAREVEIKDTPRDSHPQVRYAGTALDQRLNSVYNLRSIVARDVDVQGPEIP